MNDSKYLRDMYTCERPLGLKNTFLSADLSHSHKLSLDFPMGSKSRSTSRKYISAAMLFVSYR